MNNEVIVLHPLDNVAIALTDLSANQMIFVTIGEKAKRVTVKEDILRGHKIALKKIPKNAAVFKYGEIIGYSKTWISEGEHVHVHNIIGRDELK